MQRSGVWDALGLGEWVGESMRWPKSTKLNFLRWDNLGNGSFRPRAHIAFLPVAVFLLPCAACLCGYVGPACNNLTHKYIANIFSIRYYRELLCVEKKGFGFRVKHN